MARCSIVDGRVGNLDVRVTANRPTTFIFTFESAQPLSFTTASLWLGGTGTGGDLTGAAEYSLAVTGSSGTVTLPAFPDELYFPLRLTLDDVVVALGGLWVDPDGSCDTTRRVTLTAGDVHVTVNVIGGVGSGGGAFATVYVHDGATYQQSPGRIFIGPEDPVADGFTPAPGDQWLETV